MKVEQVASILNTVFDEICGSAVVADDLSNIVDIGRELENTSVFGDSFDTYVGKIIDKIAQVIFVDRTYISNAPNILKTGWEYGNVLEKVRIDVGEFINNKSWDFNAEQTFDDLFGFTPATVSAKYYNNKSTFSLKITIPMYQLKTAFTSAENMNRFISAIENRIKTKMTVATDSLIRMTIANLIAEKIKSGNNVINLLSLYNSATSGNLTANQALSAPPADFLRFCSVVIMNYTDYIGELSMLYNNGGYATFTPRDRLKLVLNSQFSRFMETYLYSGTYHDDYVKLRGYETVSYWQGIGTSNDDRYKISVIPASEKNADEPETITANGIIGVMFDEWAAMVANENPRTTSQYNAEKEYINYFYKFDGSFFNDTSENCVVFVIQDIEPADEPNI